MFVKSSTGAAVETGIGQAGFDLETVFRAQYGRVARIIARVVRDPARAQELAVEVFFKLWQTPKAQGDNVEGWLYRAAVRKGLTELRSRTRRIHHESQVERENVRSPEDLHAVEETHERVRLVLAVIDGRQAELLLLRSHGLSYEELAVALGLNINSVGTLLSRAEQAFRKEYTKRYGKE
jgi:RNA polymerase sigma-70 factor, ECF subfamily